jgi:ribosomal-protein-serine acetyltransferase
MFNHGLDKLDLRQLGLCHAPQLFDCIQRNRVHLRPWLVWVDGTQSVADVEQFIRLGLAQRARNGGLHVGIFADGEIIGGVGCHEIDWTHLNTSMGYWLDADAQGYGYMTVGARAFITHAFTNWRLNRLEIRCATDNVRSRALCERLGFTAEGVKRQAERRAEGFRDLVVYGLLAHEWDAQPPSLEITSAWKGG